MTKRLQQAVIDGLTPEPRKGEKTMQETEFTRELTDPFSGIVAVCPRCNAEHPRHIEGEISADGRFFRCLGCDLQFSIPKKAVESVKIGTKIYGSTPGLKAMPTNPATAKTPEPAKTEPVVKQPVPQAEAKKPAAHRTETTINPVIAEAEKRFNQFINRKEIDHV